MSRRGRHYAIATLSMCVGTLVIFGAVITMNELARAPDQEEERTSTRFEVEPPDEEPPEVAEPEPPPDEPPRESLEPPPLADLDSAIGSVEIPMPEFDMSGLDSMDGAAEAGDEDMAMTDDTVDERPEPRSRAPLRYPPRARSEGIEGYVTLSILISAEGRVQEVRVLESSPAGVFDEVAADAIREWEFEPARYEGERVRVWARQTIRFDLG